MTREAEYEILRLNNKILNENILRVLGYVFEQKNAYSRPTWLCPQDTWSIVEKLGYIEIGEIRTFIAREGSYFQSYRLTQTGRDEFFIRMSRAEESANHG
jgi:hypothetical protein